MKLWKQVLLIFILSAYAVAQPIYSVISQEEAFFLGRDLTSQDIATLIITYSMALPSLLGLILLALRKLSEVISTHYFNGTVLVLSIALFLPLFKDIYLPAYSLGLSLFISTILALLPALGITYTIKRFKISTLVLFCLSPAILAFPLWFVWQEANDPLPAPSPIITTQKPVVLIIFDEFPIVSLLDAQHSIDPVLYPNFSTLTQQSTWYRNTYSSIPETAIAIPIILTGLQPKTFHQHTETFCMNPPASAGSYPNTLFTLLLKSYQYHIFENHLNLCPATACNTKTLHSSNSITLATIARVSKSYINSILYKAGTFNSFVEDIRPPRAANADQVIKGHGHQPDLQNLKLFIASIQKENPLQSLYVFHPILPHYNWEFYPSGRQYPGMDVIDNQMLRCDENKELPFCQNTIYLKTLYQRHLLQTGFADKILGEIITRLKQEGLYDKALIVITADHGVSFLPHEYRRKVGTTNYIELMAVPLIIKRPNQHIKQIINTPTSSADILPIIADELGITLPWETDGHLIQESVIDDAQLISVCSPNKQKTYSYSQLKGALNRSLQRKLDWFSSGYTAQTHLFELGDYHNLVGKTLSLPSETLSKFRLHLDTPKEETLQNIQLDPSYPLPLQFSGYLSKTKSSQTSINLAIVLNGRIAGISQTFKAPDRDKFHFSLLIQEAAYHPGNNRLDFYEISGQTDKPKFKRIIHSTIKPNSNF